MGKGREDQVKRGGGSREEERPPERQGIEGQTRRRKTNREKERENQVRKEGELER